VESEFQKHHIPISQFTQVGFSMIFATEFRIHLCNQPGEESIIGVLNFALVLFTISPDTNHHKKID
jgi:hypothetical protein